MQIKNLILGFAIEVILFNEEQKKMFIFNYKRFKLNEINIHSIGISNKGKMNFLIRKDEYFPILLLNLNKLSNFVKEKKITFYKY